MTDSPPAPAAWTTCFTRHNRYELTVPLATSPGLPGTATFSAFLPPPLAAQSNEAARWHAMAHEYDFFPHEEAIFGPEPTHRIDHLGTSLPSSLGGGDESSGISDGFSAATSPVNSPSKRATLESLSSIRSGHSGKMDKACQPCRTRKVKCDRQWPRCNRCIAKDEECDFSRLTLASPSLTSIPEDSDRRISSLELRISQLEDQLHNSMAIYSRPSLLEHRPDASIGDTIQRAFSFTAQSSLLLRDFFAQQPASPTSTTSSPLQRFQELDTVMDESVFSSIGRKSWDWRLASKVLAKSLTLHLIDSFFNCCCSYLPVFDAFHERLRHYSESIGELKGTDKIAVACFAALGARSTPHSAVLGSPAPDPEVVLPGVDAIVAAGTRRENACRIITKECLDLYHRSDIAHDPSIVNLETILILTQMMIFTELQPRKSLSLVRTALAMLKDLFYIDLPENERQDCIRRLGIPIFNADAVIAAYAHRPPNITRSDIECYFTPAVELYIPVFGVSHLSDILDPILADAISHSSVSTVTTIISCWLAECHREFGRISPTSAIPNHLLASEIRRVWFALDEVHAGCQRVQQVLVNLSYRPSGCHSTECSDLHLRYATRLDRDLMDVVWLCAALINERFSTSREVEASVLKYESMTRVRKTLKLIAFYSQLFLSSRDLHMTYHLVWQLELLPGWTELCLQRYGETDGPVTEDLELSETELNWLHKGLHCASFYHVVAEDRLFEFQHRRRAPRVKAQSSYV